MPPVTLIENDFSGAWAIPTSGLGVGDYMQTLGYKSFLLNARCDRDAQVFIQYSEDHNTWYTLRDPEISDILAEHTNGTIAVAGSPVTITPSGQMLSAWIHNTHGVTDLKVSFDGGTTWKTISPDRWLSIPANVYSYQLDASANGGTYETINRYYLFGFMVKSNVNLTKKFYAAGGRYVRVLVQNMDTVNASTAYVDLKLQEGS